MTILDRWGIMGWPLMISLVFPFLVSGPAPPGDGEAVVLRWLDNYLSLVLPQRPGTLTI